MIDESSEAREIVICQVLLKHKYVALGTSNVPDTVPDTGDSIQNIKAAALHRAIVWLQRQTINKFTDKYIITSKTINARKKVQQDNVMVNDLGV